MLLLTLQNTEIICCQVPTHFHLSLSRHQLPLFIQHRQFITIFDNDFGVLSYPLAFTEVGEYDNWNVQKLKVKEEPRS